MTASAIDSDRSLVPPKFIVMPLTPATSTPASSIVVTA